MNKLQAIKKACALTDNIFKKIIQNFKTFKTEKDVGDFILAEIKKLNLKPAFPMIVASERNGHHIHHYPKRHKLSGFCIIDFGVKYKGYCSDLSRTIYLGKPKKRELKEYNFILNIQKKVIKKIKPNQKCAELDAYARKLMGSKAKFFTHSLGHGLGRKIHQSPKLSPKSKDKIKTGDIITIEPGLYYKNKFGIRIEDVILITKKPQLLTHSPRKLIII